MRRGDRWVNLRDIGWTPEPGEQIIRYDDPLYDGDAYYAEGHHPRSFWALRGWAGATGRARWLWRWAARCMSARWCWRATPTSAPAAPASRCSATATPTATARSGKVGPFALIRHYGFKLGIVRNTESGTDARRRWQ